MENGNINIQLKLLHKVAVLHQKLKSILLKILILRKNYRFTLLFFSSALLKTTVNLTTYRVHRYKR